GYKSFLFEDILLRRFSVAAPTQMIRLNALKSTGGYPSDLIIEDWYMWLMLSKSGGSLDRVKVILAKYRRHNENLSKRTDLMVRGRNQIVDMYQSHRFYKRARAGVMISNSIDTQMYNKIESLCWLLKAAKLDFLSLGQVRVMKCIA